MLSDLVAKLVILLLAMSLAAVPAGAQEADGFENDPASGTSESSGSGGSVFGSIFGGDDLPEGRVTDRLAEIGLRYEAPGGEQPAGRTLARLESFGPENVLVPLQKVQTYADGVVRRLIDAAQVTGLEPRVEIVSTEDIWGAAYPDGTILVSLGTLRNLETEDEFAALLGHELTHVVMRHYTADWFDEARSRGLAAFTLMIDIRDKLDEQRGEFKEEDRFSSLKSRAIAKGSATASDILLDAPFKREQEDEADYMSIDLLVAAGYRPDGMIALLDVLKTQEELKEEARERRAEARRAAAVSGKGVSGFFDQLGDALSDIGDSLTDALTDEFGNDHRPPDERVELALEYLEREYSDLAPRRKSRTAWEALQQDRDVKRVLAGYREAILARQSLVDGDLAEARKLTRAAMGKLSAKGHVLPRTVAGETRAAVGDFSGAAALFKQGLAGYQPSTMNYLGLSESLSRQRQTREALAVLDKGKKDLADPPHMLPARLTLVHLVSRDAKGAEAEAAQLFIRCRLEGGGGLEKRCNDAASGDYSVFLTDLPGQSLPAETVVREVAVTATALNGRAGPGGGFEPLVSYPKGTRLGVLAEENGWLKVRGPTGPTAWVSGGHVGPVGVAPTAAPAPAAAPANDVSARLAKIKELRAAGELSEEEYKAARERILNSL
tara:strand:+ start:146329 stop:148326 length:1998 start_codon:yes stop_codon:yes gene_type:complete